MKLVKCGKIAVASLCIAAMMAGAAVPALAVSPAGNAASYQIEETNSTEQEQIDAIRAAVKKVTVSYDEVEQSWTFDSPYQDKAGKKGICNTAPWMYIFDGYSDVYFDIDFTGFNSRGIDLYKIAVRAGDTLYSFECDPDYTDHAYIRDVQKYIETSNFELTEEEIDWFREMLSAEKVIVRFYGNDGQYDYTWTADDRQAITDMINLHDLLKAATPEVRAKALRG